MYVCISFIYVYYKYVYMYICIYVYMYIIYMRVYAGYISVYYILTYHLIPLVKKHIYIIIHIM